MAGPPRHPPQRDDPRVIGWWRVERRETDRSQRVQPYGDDGRAAQLSPGRAVYMMRRFVSTSWRRNCRHNKDAQGWERRRPACRVSKADYRLHSRLCQKFECSGVRFRAFGAMQPGRLRSQPCAFPVVSQHHVVSSKTCTSPSPFVLAYVDATAIRRETGRYTTASLQHSSPDLRLPGCLQYSQLPC